MEATKYIRDYFKGEKLSALSLLAAAIGLIILAYLVYQNVKGNIAYGFAGLLLSFSALRILASLVAYIRSVRRERMLIAGVDDEQLLVEEGKRMKKIVLLFPKIRMVQEVFFGLAFVSIFLGIAGIVNAISMGMAIAVLLQMGIWIAFDLFAQRRAEEYERRLRRVNEKK